MTDSTDLTQDEIDAITQKVQARWVKALDDHPKNGWRYERTVIHVGGHWLARTLDGLDPINLDCTAEPFVKEIAKAKRLARQRTMILACRAAMNEDEFVEWCLDVLPVLVREAA